MQFTEINVNPFAVKTPEILGAEELVNLFVPYPEYNNLQVTGHQFLHGHRGSGKSMMLRMMSPDCQMLSRTCSFLNLPYFGVYISIKATELNAPEYKRLEHEPGGTVLSEHVLTTKLLSALFVSIKMYCAHDHSININFLSFFVDKLKYSGCNYSVLDDILSDREAGTGVINNIIDIFDRIHGDTIQYIKRRSFTSDSVPYQGVLLGFQDVLLPISKSLSDNGVLPTSPIYFLLDDADNLTLQQTQILNTWVSYRTTDVVSLKISTQLNYKTYNTTSGIKIESPHDFSSINFTSIHTGSVKERYPQLVANIVQKRLARYGLEYTDPYLFFPEDEEQEKAIQKIAEEIKNSWVAGKSGYRPGDDAYRFARPEYIRRLSGNSKQGARYNYAGFDQLVHVSSGIIRFFLEPASRMFTEQQLKDHDFPVNQITTTIQDQELRKQADELLLQSFDELEEEAGNCSDVVLHLTNINRLRNLVHGIGAIFKAHIMDKDASQRRVFSFTISGSPPSQELKAILRLGVIHGYFYKDSIGSKSGLGRETLYVLTRRLAPAFSLDPIGFSNHLSFRSELLQDISINPKLHVNRLKKKGASRYIEENHLPLFDGDDYE